MPETDISSDLESLSNIIDALNSKLKTLERTGDKSMSALVQRMNELKKAGDNGGASEFIDSYDDLKKVFSGNAKEMKKFMTMVVSLSKSQSESINVMKKMGVEGKYVEDRLTKLTAEAHKGESGFHGLSGSLGAVGAMTEKLMVGFGGLHVLNNKVFQTMSSYNQELYDGVRTGNLYGKSLNEMTSAFKDMGDSVGLNSRMASKFFQTYMAGLKGSVPSMLKLTSAVKLFGDE